MEAGEGTVAASSSGLLNTKLARRKLQHDVELLSNRVERLREEERKAKQKVMETRIRGNEIAAMQARNEQQATAKAMTKRLEEDERKSEQLALKLKREQDRTARREVFQQMHQARREDVLNARKVKAENAQLVRAVNSFHLSQAQQNREQIRRQEKLVSERFEKQRQAHQEFLAQDFINMIAMEDKRREEVEKEIVKMEEEERKYIEKLKSLNIEQKDAYDKLEAALNPKLG